MAGILFGPLEKQASHSALSDTGLFSTRAVVEKRIPSEDVIVRGRIWLFYNGNTIRHRWRSSQIYE